MIGNLQRLVGKTGILLFPIIILFAGLLLYGNWFSNYPKGISHGGKDNGKDNLSKEEENPIILPWEADEDFLMARNEMDGPGLIAWYKAVLVNPFQGELANIRLAAGRLKGTRIEPGEVFSQNGSLGPYTKEKGYQPGPMFVGGRVTESVGGGVCKIASLLYNVAILADLEIVERHHHSMPVPYVPHGQDATVAYGYKDFRFKNNTGQPLLIWAGSVDNELYMALYGQLEPPAITWHHQVLQEVPFATLIIDDPDLPPGEEKILVEGMKGLLLETVLIVEYPTGEVEIRELGRSQYHPMPRQIARGGS